MRRFGLLDHGEQPLELEQAAADGDLVQVDGGMPPVRKVTVRSRDGRQVTTRVSEDVYRRIQAAKAAGCVELSVTNRRARRRAARLNRGRARPGG